MEIRSRIERSFESEAITGLNDKASKSMLLDPLNLIDKVDNNIFLSTSTLWNELEPIFQLMKDLLHENLETIANWTDREKNRGLDEPHWTLNDERSYRRAISALQASNQRRVDELKRYNADIASFNASFARKLEVMRSELDRRGADDIRLFTYVTVVFLPVGFATSVFSMNGSPSGDTLHGMIILAILALLITFIALVNARILDRVLGPLFGACRVITEGIVNPLINELHKLAQPIGKSVYLLICRSIYQVAFPLYMRLLSSPDDPKKDNQESETNDRDTEKHEQDTDNVRDPGKGDQDEYIKKKKHDKKIIELGPVHAARRDTLYIQSEKKAKEEQEMRDIEREIKHQKEKEYKKEEAKKFKESGQPELNEEIFMDMTQRMEKELEDAIEAEFEIELKAMEIQLEELDVEAKTELEARLREELEAPTRERLIKEGKVKIRQRTNAIIDKRVKGRIEREARERIELKRQEDEENRKRDEKDRKRQAENAKKQSGGFFHRIVRKTSQHFQDRSANGEPKERV
ncbi:uncharacterized protein TrAtP1_002896 [Trichoderma atroviride]|uniref:uncharacterized protein n=1 Tax=Hypocrea atroviridis TaxID=63577 RepID=UPI00331AFD41|nr:hypothetical protein TrAtP1_002896 [Trichoderma atroviride]